MKENQCSCISWCQFHGFHFASVSPLKLCFLLIYHMDFKVQHPKITCKEKSKILNENHQKSVMRQNANCNRKTRKRSIRIYLSKHIKQIYICHFLKHCFGLIQQAIAIFVWHLILKVIKNDISNMETMHIFNHACKPFFKLLFVLVNFYIKCIDNLDII